MKRDLGEIYVERMQKEFQKKLKKSEDRFRKLIQYSPEPMIIHSEGKFIYINEVGVKLIGAKNYKELIKKSIFEYIHPDYREMVFRSNMRTVTENQYVKKI